MRFFTDDGENNGRFYIRSCNVQLLPLFLKVPVIGSQFCEVQGVRGAGQWDLGWGWPHGNRVYGAKHTNRVIHAKTLPTLLPPLGQRSYHTGKHQRTIR